MTSKTLNWVIGMTAGFSFLLFIIGMASHVDPIRLCAVSGLFAFWCLIAIQGKKLIDK